MNDRMKEMKSVTGLNPNTILRIVQNTGNCVVNKHGFVDKFKSRINSVSEIVQNIKY